MADLSTDAVLFCREYRRMCESFIDCVGCPCEKITPFCDPVDNPERAAEIIVAVQAWNNEHPLKTYAQDFFEKFPNASRNKNGYPNSCRAILYGDIPGCEDMDCTDCWNEPMPEELE